MKKILLFTLLFSGFLLAQDQNNVILDKNNKPILIGEVEISDFQKEPFLIWFDEEYDNYQTDSLKMVILKENLNLYKITIVLGTWCSDSRREFPRFIKILQESNYDFENLSIIAVNRRNNEKFIGAEDLSINFVPTFILSVEEVEIGRIEESPKRDNLESDILEILGIE
jgi:thiol-disulfide isomerase/thioredoxin